MKLKMILFEDEIRDAFLDLLQQVLQQAIYQSMGSYGQSQLGLQRQQGLQSGAAIHAQAQQTQPQQMQQAQSQQAAANFWGVNRVASVNTVGAAGQAALSSSIHPSITSYEKAYKLAQDLGWIKL